MHYLVACTLCNALLQDKYQQVLARKEELLSNSETLSDTTPMVDVDLQPNSKSFSLLLEAMCDSGDFRVLEGQL